MIVADIGKVSARGQIALPARMRRTLDIEDGGSVLFFLDEDRIILKKVTDEMFSKLTEPLRKSRKNIKEGDVTALIHKMRKQDAARDH